MGLQDNDTVNPQDSAMRNEQRQGMSWERQMPPGIEGQGVFKSSVTSKFNNDLIHSEKDSNGNALVKNY